MNVLIADDHAIVREGLKQIILDTFGDGTIRQAGTGQAALEAVRAEAWDLVILDLNMPDKDGLEVLKDALALRPRLPVIVLSFHPEDQYAVRAFKAGARAYLSKETAPDQLVAAIKTVLAGRKYVSAALAERLVGDLTGETDRALHEALSDRELQVLRLLGSGKTVSEIADQICLSVKTVSTYRARLLEKLQLTTTAQLIRYALDHKLVE
ncbi:MAG: response regulator [Nitrospiraceae bacterium]